MIVFHYFFKYQTKNYNVHSFKLPTEIDVFLLVSSLLQVPQCNHNLEVMPISPRFLSFSLALFITDTLYVFLFSSKCLFQFQVLVLLQLQGKSPLLGQVHVEGNRWTVLASFNLRLELWRKMFAMKIPCCHSWHALVPRTLESFWKSRVLSTDL